MAVVSEAPRVGGGGDRRDAWLGWTAVAASAGAVLAWAACCVLPMALALAGTGMAATATLAGQRSSLTGAAAAILAAGWTLTWRRARACRIDQACRPPSCLNVALLSGASVLLVAAIAWSSLIEPKLLYLILAAGA
jgi:mercuric ion transport protein